MEIIKDLTNRKLHITRKFEAPLDVVWRAWTDSELLDLWWAPKPYRAETKFMDFKVGGHWLYAMVGPNNERHWAKAEYLKINSLKSYEVQDLFCDENGNRNHDFPSTNWQVNFYANGEQTIVKMELTYSSVADLEKIMSLGFEQGFTMALGNLDQYLKAQFKLRSELKAGNAPRVVTYLNFPGNTEEAFNFYKKVFRSEFSGKGIQRFGDIPAEAGHPPVADSIKKMILHIELPILGGHVLMATDAPKEMGFTLTKGNNMHISLEPSTREETKRLFDELSEGGNVTMPLEDMFFGSYFGECSDKYGINWMFNHITKR